MFGLAQVKIKYIDRQEVIYNAVQHHVGGQFVEDSQRQAQAQKKKKDVAAFLGLCFIDTIVRLACRGPIDNGIPDWDHDQCEVIFENYGKITKQTYKEIEVKKTDGTFGLQHSGEKVLNISSFMQLIGKYKNEMERASCNGCSSNFYSSSFHPTYFIAIALFSSIIKHPKHVFFFF